MKTKMLKRRTDRTDRHRFLLPKTAVAVTGSALVTAALAAVPQSLRADDLITLDEQSSTNSLLQLFEAQGKPLQPKKGDRTIGEEKAEEAKPAE